MRQSRRKAEADVVTPAAASSEPSNTSSGAVEAHNTAGSNVASNKILYPAKPLSIEYIADRLDTPPTSRFI